MDLSLTAASPDTGANDARNLMVDGQLRPNKVTDPRVLSAMRTIPREAFLPAPARELAYRDAEPRLSRDRAMLAPMVVARLVQALTVAKGARVLVLGAGYAAAVLASIGAEVIALEPDPAIAALAQAGFAASGVAVTLVQGGLAGGWPGAAPYDAILADGGAEFLPPLGDQLRADPPGRLALVLCRVGRDGVAMIAEPGPAGLVARPAFDAAATVLPDLRQPARFSF